MENIRRSDDGYVNLSDRLPQFKEAGGAESLDLSRIDDGTGILNTLRQNNAGYHKNCYMPYNSQHLLRYQNQQNKRDSNPLSSPVSRKRCKVYIGEAVCFFCNQKDSRENLCAVGEYRSGSKSNLDHVVSLTESWKDLALQLGELDVHAKLSVGDVRSSEIFYHKLHYTQFRNRHRASLAKLEKNNSVSLLQCYAMKQLLQYMYQIPTEKIHHN